MDDAELQGLQAAASYFNQKLQFKQWLIYTICCNFANDLLFF